MGILLFLLSTPRCQQPAGIGAVSMPPEPDEFAVKPRLNADKQVTAAKTNSSRRISPAPVARSQHSPSIKLKKTKAQSGASDINHTLGEFIRQTRTQKELSLRELARLADIDHSFLNDIEFDRRSPSEAVLVKLANGLKVPAKRLRELSVGAAMIALRKMVEEDRELNVLFIRLMSDSPNGKKGLTAIKGKLSGI